MANKTIVFVCANPIPEIWPWEAIEAGAAVIATGRSDFPNQVNNSLEFPGIFRGTLDEGARTITDEMCIAAAEELAKVQEEKGIDTEHLLPTMDDWEIFIREAVAVGLKAQEQGIACIKPSQQELWDTAAGIIKNSRDSTKILMEKNLIPAYKEYLKGIRQIITKLKNINQKSRNPIISHKYLSDKGYRFLIFYVKRKNE